MLTRRTLVATGLAATLVAGPARAAPIPLADLSRYLNALQSARSDFTQINDDGTISTGTIYIQRPGRVRFVYNPPERTLVMAGGGQVAIFDGKSNSVTPEQYPLSRTPLSIILERNVDLARRGMVVGHRQDGVKTIVTAQDPANPEYGTIELVFTGNPVELRQWVITDGSGSRTTVVLGGLEAGGSFPSRYFSIPTEVARRRG
ncbi:outer membrane lipoprotein carrier protein LolA [Oceaniovalibus guishaninsula JLT2003]|uniref:Outer membrane lipoprotein carrier protein LolA n=1 Tax=Oceaniovalibus guishaninsula JLT2003 TaxID=1231392 RepID=K2H9P1_9RHOB|nr:outer membrane lipoprotein carrier protein LolA [Oceaniovalibus guishaninsula]EKE44268.1 outer membrane lipoprotein carrier protein LolA [Oceaniovalibus guishaninsula JLT2003]